MPPVFLTVNGILINVSEVQIARAVETTRDEPAGVKVFFIHGGNSIVRDVTVEQLHTLMAEAVKAAAPF